MARHLQIGSWLVRPDLNEISRSDEVRRVGPKVMGVLLVLAERPGEVVGKEQLIERVWDGSFTSDEALSAVIYELRRALEDDARSPTYVETIRKGGYRLLAPVAEAVSEAAPAGAGVRVGAEGERAPGRRLLARSSSRRAGLLLALAAVLLLVLTGIWVRRGLGPSEAVSPGPEPIQSLAVLPLFTFSGRSEDLFAEGLTEMLTAEIAQLCPVEVAPGIALRGYPGRWDLPRAVAELGVDAVVEGSVLRSGDRLWVSVQFVETGSGRMLWGASYERRVEDEYATLRQLALEISRQVRASLASRPRLPVP